MISVFITLSLVIFLLSFYEDNIFSKVSDNIYNVLKEIFRTIGIILPAVLTIMFLSTILTFDGCIEEGFQDENVVVQHVSALGDGLHPTNDNSVNRSFIFEYTQKTLMRLDLKTLKYIPSLITEIPTKENGRISDDDLRYTYTIKDGIFWDDGSPLTAQDVDFSVKLTICRLTDNSQIRSNYSSVIHSIELHEDDPMTFTMVAHGVNWTNNSILAGIYLLQEDHWDEEGILDNISYEEINNEVEETEERYDWFFSYNHVKNKITPYRLVGLGPYNVSEYQIEEYIILKKKKDWWGKDDTLIYNQAFPDRIIFKQIKDPSAISQALKNETIDITTSIDTKGFLDLQKKKRFNETYASTFNPQFSYGYIGLNQKPDGIEYKKFFVDKNVRRAIAHLTPVKLLMKVILYNKAERQVTQIASSKLWFNKNLKPIEYDPVKAAKLLDDAGWKDTDGDEIRDKVIDGKKEQFSFQLNFYASPTGKRTVLIIQEEFKKAGIELKPNPLDFNMLFDLAKKHEFDAMMAGWGGSATYGNPMQLWHTTSWSDNGSNFCGFGDAESDELIRKANETINEEEHLDALYKLQEKIYNDQPYVFLYSSFKKLAIHRRFQDNNETDEEFRDRTMLIERPSVILNSLKLNTNYKDITPIIE